MKKRTFQKVVWLLCLAFVMAGCKDKTEVVEMVRAIKTITVSEQSTGQAFKFSGLVAAVDSSGLSFEVGGQVSAVHVDIGSRVKKGQVIAALDPEPYQLALDEAQAALTKARDNVTKTKAQYERHKRIYEQGAGAKSYLETAEYNYKAAKSAVNYQVAKLDSAKRDLRKTKLLSPYKGTIASRSVQPHEEVAAGQAIFEIDALGNLEVQLAISETLIDRLTIGGAATITFPTLPGESIPGRISDIGTAALQSNAFPVKVQLVYVNEKIKPGMTAEASLIPTAKRRESGYLVPLQAILPVKETNRGYVFVFDEQTGTVNKILVSSKAVEDKQAIIEEGLADGDVVAVAGVSFLADGMKVKLMKQ